MGRELRKVKNGWEHPVNKEGKLHPLYDEYYEDALNEWWKNHLLWNEKKHPDQDKDYKFYAEYEGNPPDIEYYRKEKWDESKDEMFYQVYENVSEGTPITPSFKTKEELIKYLVENGDFWGYKWTEKQAKEFVLQEWCISAMILNGHLYQNQEQFDI